MYQFIIFQSYFTIIDKKQLTIYYIWKAAFIIAYSDDVLYQWHSLYTCVISLNSNKYNTGKILLVIAVQTRNVQYCINNAVLDFIISQYNLKQRRLLIKECVNMRCIGYGTDMIIIILLHIILPVYIYKIILKWSNYVLKTIDALIRLSATVRT